MERTSAVNDLKVTSLSISSILEIGDSKEISAFSQAIALQREKELFFDSELQFSHYPIFQRNHPFIHAENVSFHSYHYQPFIKVGKMTVQATSTSSIIHIGTTKKAYLEARVKHIRHLERKKKNKEGSYASHRWTDTSN